ncbi:MAG TPA: SpoIID/LytB domain-containing protein [Candidatus Nitrosotenuis sp.]|nr:SpoIID/LytB domain-containing protein [Candidatus Nitrosotenuis sp.]
MRSLLVLWILLLPGRPALAAETVRVALALGAPRAVVEGQGGLTLKPADGSRVLARLPGPVTLRAGKEGLVVSSATFQSTVDAPVLLVPPGGVFYLRDGAYRGYLKVVAEPGGLTLVNCLPMDDYVAGVLGGEVAADWPSPSLAAMAVAVRTYALYMARHPEDQSGIAPRSPHYDLVNTVADQVYRGRDGESAAFRRAVRTSAGQVLTRADGAVIKAYYHASCGGHTTDSAQVFGTRVPALAGVEDPFCGAAPHAFWSRTWSAEQIRGKLAARGWKLGLLARLEASAYDASGRILTFVVEDVSGRQLALSGKELRAVLGYSELPSTRCQVRVLASRLGTDGSGARRQVPGTVRFQGSGWGHGVGLCQWGAREMGRQGYSYEEILAHYYPGTRLCHLEQ